MPYCPKCRDEFQASMQTCPVCGADLATELPASERKPGKAREPLVYVATAPNEVIARMWVGLLQNNGVRSTMQGGPYMSSWSVNPYLPHEIYVLPSEAQRAREILDGLPDL
jgi:hypothetical protein